MATLQGIFFTITLMLGCKTRIPEPEAKIPAQVDEDPAKRCTGQDSKICQTVEDPMPANQPKQSTEPEQPVNENNRQHQDNLPSSASDSDEYQADPYSYQRNSSEDKDSCLATLPKKLFQSCGQNQECFIESDPAEGLARQTIKTKIWEYSYQINKLESPTSQNAIDQDEESACRADIMVAMAMQEAHSFKSNVNRELPYDHLKDTRIDGSQNVSIFNMNLDFIKRSCRSNCSNFQNFNAGHRAMYLNKKKHLPEAIRRLSEGFDTFGIRGSLYFHRGGYSGYQTTSDDERNFASRILQVAKFLNQNRGYRRNSDRIAHSIARR